MTTKRADYSSFKDGRVKRRSKGFYRGDTANFLPSDVTYAREGVIGEYLVKGTVPPAPFIDEETNIVAFGSCFAGHISNFLKDRGYNIATKKDGTAYISRMRDGIVNTFAIRQQFEWAWLNQSPQVDLWHGYDALALGYDEEVRLKTRELFDNADVFIITVGLSEVWYDEPTGEVFWRAVPEEHFDASRHKFRNTTVEENRKNLEAIYALIREYRPDAHIVLTLSPIPLLATFRDLSCYAANSVSKSVLRVALDEMMRKLQSTDDRLFYFPSYEIVMNCFNHQFMEDRRHVHNHVLNFNMNVFLKYFCTSGMTESELYAQLCHAQKLDRRVGRYGHWSVERSLQERAYRPKYPPLHIRLQLLLERLQSRRT